MAALNTQHEPIGLPVQTASSIVASKGALAPGANGEFAKLRTEALGVVRPGSLAVNDSSKREETLEYWLFCGDGSGMRQP